MNDFDFKNALISKIKISNRYLYDKNKVTKVLEECDFDIKYTKKREQTDKGRPLNFQTKYINRMI